jgi:hypothetical protein
MAVRSTRQPRFISLLPPEPVPVCSKALALKIEKEEIKSTCLFLEGDLCAESLRFQSGGSQRLRNFLKSRHDSVGISTVSLTIPIIQSLLKPGIA